MTWTWIAAVAANTDPDSRRWSLAKSVLRILSILASLGLFAVAMAQVAARQRASQLDWITSIIPVPIHCIIEGVPTDTKWLTGLRCDYLGCNRTFYQLTAEKGSPHALPDKSRHGPAHLVWKHSLPRTIGLRSGIAYQLLLKLSGVQRGC